jgi:3-phenylpropionate/trans-cinnamate dioxygenase ferredoxin reductase subunit
MNVNVWDVTDPIQELIRTRRQVPVASLTDVDTPLERLAG